MTNEKRETLEARSCEIDDELALAVPALDAEGIAECMRGKGLPILTRTIERYLQSGRGPIYFHPESDRRHVYVDDLVRYLNHAWIEHYASSRLPEVCTARPNRDALRGLLLAGDYDFDRLSGLMCGWGCEVEAAFSSPMSILQHAAWADCDLALLDLDHNTEVAIAAVDCLHERKIPFIMQSRMSEQPSIFTAYGTVVERPASAGRLRNVIREVMPLSIVERMKFDQFLSNTVDGAETIAPAPRRFVECDMQLRGRCECDPAAPECAGDGDAAEKPVQNGTKAA